MTDALAQRPTIEMLLVGKPKAMGQEDAEDQMDRPWTSAIFKEPVEKPLWLSKTLLEGDGQANLKAHGGPEKAVLAYYLGHYEQWRKELNFPELTDGSFGENFCVSELKEEDVCIGDTYQVGEAVVQVSQPRQPCWKLARKWRIKDLALRVQETGRTGWYFRVLREGYVKKGDSLMRLERPCPEWTIRRCNEIMYDKSKTAEAAELASCPHLAKSWADVLSKRA